MTSTKGASSSSRSAWRNGAKNSSPPSVGESTLLWRLTFGSPGIAPSRTSSMLGWPAAVIETVSPSQLMPSEIQRMCTSSTPAGACASAAIALTSVTRGQCVLKLLQLQRVDQQLLTAGELDVEPAAGRAAERKAGHGGLRVARAAAALSRQLRDRE